MAFGVACRPVRYLVKNTFKDQDERHRFRRRHILQRPNPDDAIEGLLDVGGISIIEDPVEDWRKLLPEGGTHRVGKGVRLLAEKTRRLGRVTVNDAVVPPREYLISLIFAEI